MCTACLRACKHPRGCQGVLRVLHGARVSGCSMCLHAGTCERAQPQQQQMRGQISMFPHAGPCAIMCTLTWVCTRVCKPLFPGHLLPAGPLAGPLAAPRTRATLQGTGVHAAGHIHTRVHRRVVTHPAAVGKAPLGWGLPRRSCWVTARPNDAMSLFAYAKQHLCCGFPGKRPCPPLPGSQTGCQCVSHARTPHPALAPHVSRGLLH